MESHLDLAALLSMGYWYDIVMAYATNISSCYTIIYLSGWPSVATYARQVFSILLRFFNLSSRICIAFICISSAFRCQLYTYQQVL